LRGGDIDWESFLCLVAEVYKNRFLEEFSHLARLRKPVIAAVSGYAVSIRNWIYYDMRSNISSSLVEGASLPSHVISSLPLLTPNSGNPKSILVSYQEEEALNVLPI